MTAAILSLVFTACGTDVGDLAPPHEEAGTTLDDIGRPPDLIVTSGDERLSLEPWTYCWQSGAQGVCADGIPTDPPPAFLEPVTELAFEYPIDWRTSATFYPDTGIPPLDGRELLRRFYSDPGRAQRRPDTAASRSRRAPGRGFRPG